MRVTRVQLQSYRNYENAVADLSDGVNVFMGANAQGKTNFAEAIILCCIGRSPRTPRDKELIKWGERAAYARIDGVRAQGKVTVETVLTQTENKRIQINGLPIKRIGELMSTFNCVFFSPDELKIVKAGPSDRRRFLDIDISQLSKTYFYELNRYTKILNQRNKLLKSGRATTETLYVWDIQLAQSGARIVRQRREFCRRIDAFARDCHSKVTNGKETLSVSYEGIEGETEKEISDNFTSLLAGSVERDQKLGFTTQGAHKDDFSVQADGVDLRTYGSQGQQRTAALSLKLAELGIFKTVRGEYPLLILDDVLSELDTERQTQLLNSLDGVQTIITCTHLEQPIDGAVIYTVQNGTITRQV